MNDKSFEWRMQGMIYACKMAKEKGIEYLCSRRKEKRQILFLRKVTDDDYDANDDTFLALEIPSLPSLASSECGEQQGEG